MELALDITDRFRESEHFKYVQREEFDKVIQEHDEYLEELALDVSELRYIVHQEKQSIRDYIDSILKTRNDNVEPKKYSFKYDVSNINCLVYKIGGSYTLIFTDVQATMNVNIRAIHKNSKTRIEPIIKAYCKKPRLLLTELRKQIKKEKVLDIKSRTITELHYPSCINIKQYLQEKMSSATRAIGKAPIIFYFS